MATTALTFIVTVTKRQQTGFGFDIATVTKLAGSGRFTLRATGGQVTVRSHTHPATPGSPL